MMEQFFSASMVLAVIGAIPGAIRGWARRKRDFLGGASDALIGLVLAASVADWLTPPKQPAVALLVGLVAGMVGAPAIDAAHELVPSFMRELVLGWARRLTRSSDMATSYTPPQETVIEEDNSNE